MSDKRDYSQEVIKVGKRLQDDGLILDYVLEGGMLRSGMPDKFRLWMCYDPIYDYCITIQNVRSAGGHFVGMTHTIDNAADLIKHVTDYWDH